MANNLLSGIVEHDLNPFFLFDARGRALILNQSAELLLGYASPLSFFLLAQRYEGKNYELQFEQLSFRSFHFFALMVARDNDQLALRLYQTLIANVEIPSFLDEAIHTNIYKIIDANIALYRSRGGGEVSTNYDLTLPMIKVALNGFARLIGRCFDSFSAGALTVILSVRSKAAEPYASLVIVGEKRKLIIDQTIESLAKEMKIRAQLSGEEIVLDIPLA